MYDVNFHCLKCCVTLHFVISTKLRDKLRHNSHSVFSVLTFAGHSGSKQLWDQFPNIFQIYLLDLGRKNLLSEDAILRKYEF